MPAGSSAEPQGRLIAFFINVQAAGDGWGPNLTVLTNLASALVPKVTGGRNLWEQGASEGLSLTERSSDGAQDVDVVPLGGQADNPSVATELKAQPIDSSSPSLQNSGGKQDKKCTVPIGTVIEYADRESSAGGHMRLKRRSALKVCPQMPSDVYVFSPHWTFKDKN